MPLLDNDVQVFDAPPPRFYMLQWPQVKTCPCNQWAPWKWTPPISANTPPLVYIIILKPDAQQTLNNILDMQMDPLVNPPNIVVDGIKDITLEPSVGLHMIINTSAPQVANPNPKVARLEKLVKGDSNSNHAPINQYLRHPRPPILEVLVGSRLVNVTTSMNHLLPPIKDSSTCWIIWKEKHIVQTTIAFVGEYNYEQPHIDDGILDIEGRCPTKQIMIKDLGWNIITTLCGTNISEAEEGRNDDDDDNNTNIHYEAIEAPNDNGYHEPQPQHLNSYGFVP
jgi:hypothetical protein